MTKRVHKIKPKAELGAEKLFYIENHLSAGIPLDIIAYRLDCDIVDIETIAKKERIRCPYSKHQLKQSR